MTSDSKKSGDGANPLGENGVKVEEIRPEEDDNSHSCRTFVIHKEDHTLGNALR